MYLLLGAVIALLPLTTEVAFFDSYCPKKPTLFSLYYHHWTRLMSEELIVESASRCRFTMIANKGYGIEEAQGDDSHLLDFDRKKYCVTRMVKLSLTYLDNVPHRM